MRLELGSERVKAERYIPSSLFAAIIYRHYLPLLFTIVDVLVRWCDGTVIRWYGDTFVRWYADTLVC
jgi:hypothetical protein